VASFALLVSGSFESSSISQERFYWPPLFHGGLRVFPQTVGHGGVPTNVAIFLGVFVCLVAQIFGI